MSTPLTDRSTTPPAGWGPSKGSSRSPLVIGCCCWLDSKSVLRFEAGFGCPFRLWWLTASSDKMTVGSHLWAAVSRHGHHLSFILLIDLFFKANCPTSTMEVPNTKQLATSKGSQVSWGRGVKKVGRLTWFCNQTLKKDVEITKTSEKSKKKFFWIR